MSKGIETLYDDLSNTIEASVSGIDSLDHRICEFCKKSYGKYSCPRCQQLYCSLTCYQCRAHNSCVVSFQRENAADLARSGNARLQQTEISVEDKKRLLELVNEFEIEAQERPLGQYESLLKRRNSVITEQSIEQDETEDEGQDESQEEWDKRKRDLEKRMKNIDLDTADFDEIWSNLTIGEQADFIRLVEAHRNELRNEVK
ncbi:hypothetical protein V1511DRAFT_493876 [Dipodascopsis uninucleata]